MDEAINLFVSGDPELAKLILQDIDNSTVGFGAHEVRILALGKSAMVVVPMLRLLPPQS